MNNWPFLILLFIGVGGLVVGVAQTIRDYSRNKRECEELEDLTKNYTEQVKTCVEKTPEFQNIQREYRDNAIAILTRPRRNQTEDRASTPPPAM